MFKPQIMNKMYIFWFPVLYPTYGKQKISKSFVQTKSNVVLQFDVILRVVSKIVDFPFVEAVFLMSMSFSTEAII